ncbi:hypothetical protein QYF36_004009 [Acer negundo]|nr:hypothetical protein QYF36_004009 [Acer negundo]
MFRFFSLISKLFVSNVVSSAKSRPQGWPLRLRETIGCQLRGVMAFLAPPRGISGAVKWKKPSNENCFVSNVVSSAKSRPQGWPLRLRETIDCQLHGVVAFLAPPPGISLRSIVAIAVIVASD